MLNRLPKFLPTLKEMMQDCFNVTPQELAKALGVTERTVWRWLKNDSAPKAVLLSLFWLTRWGMSQTNAEVHNLASLHMSMSSALRSELGKAQQEIKALQSQIEHLGRLGDFGSANDPAVGVTGPGPVDSLRLTFVGFEQECTPMHAARSQAIKARAFRGQGIPTFKNQRVNTAPKTAARVARG
jgi:predicted DNA-binding transcriptional regulator AlpA